MKNTNKDFSSNFESVDFCYKAVIKPFGSNKQYISKESFKTWGF